jgi:WD40 repeat protein
LVKVWDLKTGKNVHSYAGHIEPILAVTISPDGKAIATGSRNDVIKIWAMG